MKYKRKILICIFVALAVISCGCDKKTKGPNIVISGDGISVDIYSFKNSNCGSVIIPFAYINAPEKVVLLSVNGEKENCSNIKLSYYKENNNDDISYKGYKMSVLMLDVKVADADVSINDMEISFDDEIYTLHFNEKIFYEVCENSENPADVGSGIGAVCFNTKYEQPEIQLYFPLNAASDFVIDSTELRGNYSISDIAVTVNGEGVNDEKIPIKKGDYVEFYVNIQRNNNALSSIINFILNIDINGESEKYIYIVGTQIGIEDTENVLKMILDGSLE